MAIASIRPSFLRSRVPVRGEYTALDLWPLPLLVSGRRWYFGPAGTVRRDGTGRDVRDIVCASLVVPARSLAKWSEARSRGVGGPRWQTYEDSSGEIGYACRLRRDRKIETPAKLRASPSSPFPPFSTKPPWRSTSTIYDDCQSDSKKFDSYIYSYKH